MNANPRIEVLLATYNGERFLREQIESILAQDYENLTVLARDDGSSDSTADILLSYEREFPERFRVMPSSPGTGNPKLNFLLLMKASTAAYVCLSDQDDLWLPDKVRKAMSLMRQLESQWGEHTPALVFSDLRVVDQQLLPLKESMWAHFGVAPEFIERFATLLNKNVVTGCTTMLNRRLVALSQRMSDEAVMHDHWIAMVACAFGKSAFVREQLVLYRQHGRNALGVRYQLEKPGNWGPGGLFLERLRQFRKDRVQIVNEWLSHQRQADAFLRVYHNELSPSHCRLLKAFRQCELSKSVFVRLTTWIRYGFYGRGKAVYLAIFLHLSRLERFV